MPDTENFHAIRYGNRDAEIKFGHIHDDQQISAFSVRSGADPRHYMSMESMGSREFRKGSTINRCPGSYQIKCGDDVRTGSEDGFPAFYVECVGGDIIFSAKKGRIKFEAENFEFLARGADNQNGIITLNANEKVEIISKNVEVKASSIASFYSSNTCKIVGKAVLDFYGGMTACATGASKGKPSKYASTPADQNNNLGG